MVAGREAVIPAKDKDEKAKKAKKAAAKEEARREREEEGRKKQALVEERRRKREREEAKEASELAAKKAKKVRSAPPAKKNTEVVRPAKSGKAAVDKEDDDNSSEEEGTVNLDPREDDEAERALTVWEKLTMEMREVLEAAGFPESTCNRMSHNEVRGEKTWQIIGFISTGFHGRSAGYTPRSGSREPRRQRNSAI